MLYKNTAGQKIAVYAYDVTTGLAKTGDASNITCYQSLDWGAAAQLADTNPTEMDATNLAGWYVFDLAQAETNAEVGVFAPVSVTANVVLDQVQVFFQDASISSRASQTSLDTIDGIVDAIVVDTGTDIPAAIAALNDLSAAEAQAAAAAAIVAADVATGAEVAALNDLSAADVWAYGTRTLTQTAAEVAAAVAGSTLTIHRGDTFTATLTGLGSLADYVSLDFTVKSKRSDDDDSAVVRIRLNATGLGDGLLRINAAEAGTPGNGSITIDDLAAGDVTLTLAADETEGLTPHVGYFYDIQMITATAVETLTAGTCNVTADVTRAVV